MKEIALIVWKDLRVPLAGMLVLAVLLTTLVSLAHPGYFWVPGVVPGATVAIHHTGGMGDLAYSAISPFGFPKRVDTTKLPSFRDDRHAPTPPGLPVEFVPYRITYCQPGTLLYEEINVRYSPK